MVRITEKQNKEGGSCCALYSTRAAILKTQKRKEILVAEKRGRERETGFGQSKRKKKRTGSSSKKEFASEK